MNPLISIVVPTKNRYKYLKHLISLIESFNDDRIELLVHDNSENNADIIDFLSTKELVSTIYYYDSNRLSMSENAERAIDKCSGDYVCFIGDDDAVCRNIADCAEWMKTNNVDAVRSLYLQYGWNEDMGGACGSMYYEDVLPTYSIGDPIKELKKVLNEGVPNFGCMTKIYHGIVKKSVIEKVQQMGECLFPGPTPDMSGAVSISFFIKKYAMINLPVVIPGMSRMVGGGVMGKVLALDEVLFITDKDRSNWPSYYPKYWATELIWPVCVLNALRSVRKQEYKQELNHNKMFSRLVLIHHSYFREVLHYSNNKLSFLIDFALYCVSEGYRCLKERIIMPHVNGKMYGKYNFKDGFETIADAEKFLMNNIKNYSFNKLKLVK